MKFKIFNNKTYVLKSTKHVVNSKLPISYIDGLNEKITYKVIKITHVYHGGFEFQVSRDDNNSKFFDIPYASIERRWFELNANLLKHLMEESK